MVWVELDGVPFKFWSGPTFKRIAAKWGELLDVDDYDESNLHSKRICILSKGWTPAFPKRRRERRFIVADINDGRINDLEGNSWIDESDGRMVLEPLFDQPDAEGKTSRFLLVYTLINKGKIELARKVTEEDHIVSNPSGFTLEEG
ncbi:nucleotide-binding alpha-beta plait domain-containing protein [Tanacetum coccineum]